MLAVSREARAEPAAGRRPMALAMVSTDARTTARSSSSRLRVEENGIWSAVTHPLPIERVARLDDARVMLRDIGIERDGAAHAEPLHDLHEVPDADAHAEIAPRKVRYVGDEMGRRADRRGYPAPSNRKCSILGMTRRRHARAVGPAQRLAIDDRGRNEAVMRLRDRRRGPAMSPILATDGEHDLPKCALARICAGAADASSSGNELVDRHRILPDSTAGRMSARMRRTISCTSADRARAEGRADIVDSTQRMQVEIELALEAAEPADIAMRPKTASPHIPVHDAAEQTDEHIDALAVGRLEYLVGHAWIAGIEQSQPPPSPRPLSRLVDAPMTSRAPMSRAISTPMRPTPALAP